MTREKGKEKGANSDANTEAENQQRKKRSSINQTKEQQLAQALAAAEAQAEAEALAEAEQAAMEDIQDDLPDEPMEPLTTPIPTELQSPPVLRVASSAGAPDLSFGGSSEHAPTSTDSPPKKAGPQGRKKAMTFGQNNKVEGFPLNYWQALEKRFEKGTWDVNYESANEKAWANIKNKEGSAGCNVSLDKTQGEAQFTPLSNGVDSYDATILAAMEYANYAESPNKEIKFELDVTSEKVGMEFLSKFKEADLQKIDKINVGKDKTISGAELDKFFKSVVDKKKSDTLQQDAGAGRTLR